MNPDEVTAEMRLFVVENLLALLWAGNHMLNPNPSAVVSEFREKLIAKCRNQTFSTVDPVSSDLLSAELEVAVDRAISMQQEWMGLRRPKA